MRVTIMRLRDDATEHVENVRYTDEIAEDEGMSDADFEAMTAELQQVGRYWLAADRYATTTIRNE